MTQDSRTCLRRAFVLSFSIAAALLGGCMTYSPQNISGTSTVDLCELRQNQGSNLSQQSRASIDDEVRRRNDNCGNYTAELSQRRAAFMYQEMYGKQSP